jgi:hypothetical protein
MNVKRTTRTGIVVTCWPGRTLAYLPIVCMIGSPVLLPWMYAFTSATRNGWTAWFADAQWWFSHLCSVVLTYCTTRYTALQLEFKHILPAAHAASKNGLLAYGVGPQAKFCDPHRGQEASSRDLLLVKVCMSRHLFRALCCSR